MRRASRLCRHWMVPSNIFILAIGLLMGTSVLVSNRFGAGDTAKTARFGGFPCPGALSSALWGLPFVHLARHCFSFPAKRRNWRKRAAHFFIAGLVAVGRHPHDDRIFSGRRAQPATRHGHYDSANIINIGANYVLVRRHMAFPNWVPKGQSGLLLLLAGAGFCHFVLCLVFSRPRQIWHRPTGLGPAARVKCGASAMRRACPWS